MAWRSWPGDSAFGRGISRANMGVSTKVRVELYRRVRWEENTYRFTRARFNFNGQGWAHHSCFELPEALGETRGEMRRWSAEHRSCFARWE
jgi:hypothetical protein